MSIKTTLRITRERAIELLRSEIDDAPNDLLARLLDIIADNETSKRLSIFDNFIVSEFS
jgi:hypothetical protein